MVAVSSGDSLVSNIENKPLTNHLPLGEPKSSLIDNDNDNDNAIDNDNDNDNDWILSFDIH